MSDRHLGEEDMVLHHYGEAEDPQAVQAHLEACADCASAFRGLESALGLVPGETVPERDAAYGTRVWERVKAELPPSPRTAEAGAPAPARRYLPSHLGAWGALAASLLLAFSLGRWGAAPAPPVARERILLVAVGDHLERSRMVLAEISNAPKGGPNGLRAEQRWAGSLLLENRLYRQAAVRGGDAPVAGLLEELERVLAEVANGPDDLSAKQIEDLQARIEARGLLFKVKVVEGQVRARARRLNAPKETL